MDTNIFKQRFIENINKRHNYDCFVSTVEKYFHSGKLFLHLFGEYFSKFRIPFLVNFEELLSKLIERYSLPESQVLKNQTEETVREVEPYLLKEFNGRWYILLKDSTDNNIKTFGTDRIHNIEITKKKYSKQQDFNPKDYYKDCFGIFKSNELKPTEIILSFEPLQGKYIKTYPLHSSQEILIDSEKELQIRLFVYESPDLITELLSFGDKVKVLQPQSLIDTMIDKIKVMTKKYDV